MRPEFPIYYAPTSPVRVQIGMESENTNVLNNYVQRDWKLRDIDGAVVDFGTMSVLINSFDSYLDVNVPIVGVIYVLEIENESSNQLCVICKQLISETVDEFHPFTGDLHVYGNLVVTGSTTKYVRLPATWDLYSRKSNGLIVSDNTVYTFTPSRILTHLPSPPAYIDYEAFPSTPTVQVVVNKLPIVTSTGRFTYAVAPPTRLEITWYTRTGVNVFDTNVPVSSFSMLDKVGALSFEVLPQYGA